ncbi:MAG: aspartate/glutamate racemase family protein [Deltaproteobacteria bacterium]|nr:aspartate/glutamate racemase family protein [Deltaproteobacteria bacterium]
MPRSPSGSHEKDPSPIFMKTPAIGILMLDHTLARPPGDPGNPATFRFPVIHETVSGVTLERLLEKDPGILDPLTASARRLVEAGAAAVTSGCGFFIYFQEALARLLPVPVMLSSLLQIPFIQKTLGPNRRIGVLTAHAGRLTRVHLLLAGMDPRIPVKVTGLETEPHFRAGVLVDRGRYAAGQIQEEVVSKAVALVKTDDGGPPVGAVLMECTNLPPFAAAVQEAVKLPVFDVTTMVAHFFGAVFRSRFS